MSAVTERVNEARDYALSQVARLEDLEKFSHANEWSEVEQGFIDDMGIDVDDITPLELIGKWFSYNVYDIRVSWSLTTFGLEKIEVMTAGFGPTIWVSYNGNADGVLVVNASWDPDKWESWANAPTIASYLWELAEGYKLAGPFIRH